MPSTMVLAGSSSEYFRSMLNSGITAYQNDNFEEALYIFEMCGNQHNINRYADKCRNNIPKVKKMIADKATEEKRIADAKAAEEKRIADAKAAEEYKKSPEGIKEEKERVEAE